MRSLVEDHSSEGARGKRGVLLGPWAEGASGLRPRAPTLVGADTRRGARLRGLGVSTAPPGANAPNLTGKWVPRRGAGRLARGLPLAAEPENYM